MSVESATTGGFQSPLCIERETTSTALESARTCHHVAKDEPSAVDTRNEPGHPVGNDGRVVTRKSRGAGGTPDRTMLPHVTVVVLPHAASRISRRNRTSTVTNLARFHRGERVN